MPCPDMVYVQSLRLYLHTVPLPRIQPRGGGTPHGLDTTPRQHLQPDRFSISDSRA
jgi:hypothetical protein